MTRRRVTLTDILPARSSKEVGDEAFSYQQSRARNSRPAAELARKFAGRGVSAGLVQKTGQNLAGGQIRILYLRP
jgi:hypothetical protein